MSTTTTTTDYGDQIVATATFTNAAGSAAEPTTVRWRLRAPDGTETAVTSTGGAYTLANPATGTHTLTFTPDATGTWYIRCEGLGAVQQAAEAAHIVNRSRLTTASIS